MFDLDIRVALTQNALSGVPLLSFTHPQILRRPLSLSHAFRPSGGSRQMIGQTVSHYRILQQLGEGGMGVVYLAEDTSLGRRVAIKFLLDASRSGSHRARFLREARAASALDHPHIAKIYDYGETPDGQPFIVMELVGGQTMYEMLTTGALGLERAFETIEHVAEALGEAHRHGIIHRDIKPSNASPLARNMYEEGTDAMRDGTYYKASKLLSSAVEADPN